MKDNKVAHDLLFNFLESRVNAYNNRDFIPSDPISIPHQFTKKQDREISGLFAATLAFGRRSVSITKAKQLMKLMGNEPHKFIVNHKEKDLKPFTTFVHRTFQPTDVLHFIHKLKLIYVEFNSLDDFFSAQINGNENKVEQGLTALHNFFFSCEDDPLRSRKHLPSPARKSTCKRLNLFLRWMARKDNAGVDFGIWHSLAPKDLLIPYDVHVERLAKHLGLVTRKSRDWKAVMELTENLKQFDAGDPVKYDFALFGEGVGSIE